MPILFHNRYRIASIRLPQFDYAQAGYYFITICTKNRQPWFGEIRNGMMCVNEVGTTAYNCWYAIPNHFPHVSIDTFVVMPDHVHGIVKINRQYNHTHNDVVVETLHATSLPLPQHEQPSNIQTNSQFFSSISPKSSSLPIIIRSFKSAITNKCHADGYKNFQWQPRFYDRIIHNASELNVVRQYIIDNPKNWKPK